MKRRRTLAWFLLTVLLFQYISIYGNSVAFAGTYPSTEEEFREYVEEGLGKEYTRIINGTPQNANFETYQKYNVLAWGDPFGDFQAGGLNSGNKCGADEDEYRYLGYAEDGQTSIENACFRDDETGSENFSSWNYVLPPSDLRAAYDQSWDDVESSVVSYVLDAPLQNNSGTKDAGITLRQIGGKNYAKLGTAPTIRAEGYLTVWHQPSSGKMYYYTFRIPPMGEGEVSFQGDFPSVPSSLTITADSKEIVSRVKARAQLISENQLLQDSHVEYLKNEYLYVVAKGKNDTGWFKKYPKFGWTTNSQPSTMTLEHESNITFDRAQFPAENAPYSIQVVSEISYRTNMGGEVSFDKQVIRSSEFSLNVEEYSGEPYVKTTVTVDPASIEYQDKDIQVKVTVKGEVQNLTNPSSIDDWIFSAREKEVTAAKTTIDKNEVLTNQTTFDFTIPKSKIENGMVNDQYIQEYVGRAKIKFKDGSLSKSNSDDESTVIYKDQAPLPQPNGPVAEFTYSPNSDLKQGDKVNFKDQTTHPDDVPIISWEWRINGSVFSTSQNPSTTLDEIGSNMITLKVTDANGLIDTVSKVINADQPNIPPTATFFVEDEYFWVENVSPQNNSYDPDGTIVSNDWSLNGRSSTLPFTFSRVTTPELYTMGLSVTDDAGDSDYDSESVRILPTIPTADFQIYSYDKDNNQINNAGKVNRLIEIDATLSDAATPSSDLVPIDYSKTTYDLRPLTTGIDPDGIKIRTDSDKSKLQFLVRAAGEYEVSVTVTNELDETSKVVTKKFTVDPDEDPIARFTVGKKKYLRDGTTNTAIITLTDLTLAKNMSPEFCR